MAEGRHEEFNQLDDPDLRPVDEEAPGMRRLKDLLAARLAAHPIRVAQENLSGPERRELENEPKALGYIE